MIAWRFHHLATTVSTNLDARSGAHGDVFTADYQTAGRGRLDHRWLSPPGTNLMMSAVMGVDGAEPEKIATLPLVVGLAVATAVQALLPDRAEQVRLKWPNDVLVAGKKVAGILCERSGEVVIAGIGVNVRRQSFAPELVARATALELDSVAAVRDAVLAKLGELYERWRGDGLASVHDELTTLDYLKGRCVSVRQTDDDAAPIEGICDGIALDGSLVVGGRSIYAGEAHVVAIN